MGSRREPITIDQGRPEAGSGTSVSATLPPPPAPAEGASLSEYKGYSLKNIGLDVNGKTIPHKYSSKTAKQITLWVAGGADANAICVRLNMRPGKLKELYGKELAIGLDTFGMDLTTHLAGRAKKSDRVAIFMAKARLGWRDGDSKPIDTGVLEINIHL